MKLIVLGLDGFSPYFLKKWESDLPHLKALINNGVYGTLESTIPPTTLPAWVSMFTGEPFSRIEAFGLVNLNTTYALTLVDPSPWKGEYVWDILSEKGITVGIFSLPFLKEVYRIQGLMIAEPVMGGDMYPPGIIQLPPIDGDQLKTKEKEIRWHIFYQKPSLFKKLVEKNYDFYFFLISISDVIMHLSGEKELKKAYKEIDKEIIPVITTICQEHQYDLLIVSDHGAKKTYKKFNINTFLNKKGYLTVGESLPIAGLVQKMMEVLPIEIVRKLRDLYTKTNKELFPRIQYETTTAFGSGAGNTSYCGIWLNKKDVFKKGIVTKEKEKPLLTQLIADLKKVKEIDAVFTRADLGYPDMLVFPDLVIKTSKDIATYLPVFPSVVHKSEEIVHSRSGIVIAYGPHIAQGTIKANINDITPTILHFFGLPIPRNKGDVLTEIFTTKRAPKYVDSDYYKKQENKKIKRAVKKVLKA